MVKWRIYPHPEPFNSHLPRLFRACFSGFLHSGRHSFASLVTLEQGVPIETISRMLGHSNIQTTQIYARVTPAKLFEDMDKFIEATADLRLVI